MIVRGRIFGVGVVVFFEVRKDERGFYVRVEFLDKFFEYLIDCFCFEFFEFFGFFFLVFEEEFGEVKGVFVEKVEKEKYYFFLKSFLRFFLKGGYMMF